MYKSKNKDLIVTKRGKVRVLTKWKYTHFLVTK